MEKESLFLSYVRLTLKKWAGFQAAIEDGMGGFYAKEKELWMGAEIENYFKKYSHVTPDDIEEYIAAMVENEFDTYFEDESLLEISKMFCEAYELSKVNPNSPIFAQIIKRPESSSSPQSCSRQSSQCGKVLEEKTDTEKTVVSNMETLSINGTNDEEWTLVTRKSHKN